ncbi:MAG: alpha/beta hydrolase [Verrucomicrobiales bacterium]|nr:alpha/beta hydrolase [Verrucomicrobiales bacterium]
MEYNTPNEMDYPVHHLCLPDDRVLAFSEFGCPEGIPVFYHHGWPACRLEAILYEEQAKAAGVRLISLDRPGFGESTFQDQRTLLDWPDDLSRVGDFLGFDQFHLLGHSGGGPYVAACAAKIPHRLLGTTIVAGLSPMTDRRTREGMRFMNQVLLSLGRRFPWLLNRMMKLTRKMSQDPEQMKKGMADLPENDKAIMFAMLPRLTDLMKVSFAQGTAGATREGRIYASPWGFELSEISVPVTIWQGTLDVNVPQSNGKLFADEIPKAKFHLIEGEGHFSLAVNHGERILRDLVGGGEL